MVPTLDYFSSNALYFCGNLSVKKDRCDLILRAVSKSRIWAIVGSFIGERERMVPWLLKGVGGMKARFGQAVYVHAIVSSNEKESIDLMCNINDLSKFPSITPPSFSNQDTILFPVKLPAIAHTPLLFTALKIISQWCFFAWQISAKNPTHYFYYLRHFRSLSTQLPPPPPISSTLVNLKKCVTPIIFGRRNSCISLKARLCFHLIQSRSIKCFNF